MKFCGLLPKEASLTRSRDVVSFAPSPSFMLAAELRSFLAFPVAGVELHSRKTDRCRQELQCLSDDSRRLSVVLTINLMSSLSRYVYILIYGIV